MITELQKRTAQAIVNIFETGRPEGDYSKVTLFQGDSGHLTYGRSQTTLASGNLYLLIKSYCETAGAGFAAELREYLERLAHREISLDNDTKFRSLLRSAGEDAVMHDVQDDFFDRVYWSPSVRTASSIGVNSGLGVTVIYDSRIHGSWARMRDRTNSRHGEVSAIGEWDWISRYVDERRDWLANHSNTLLRRTVYRMNAFRKLISAENWDLNLPFRVRGIWLDEELLLEPRPIRASAQDVEERLLMLQNPYMRGDDVREVQQALQNVGFTISMDGIFGPQTQKTVEDFQKREDLIVDGIVGPVTRSALGL